MNQISQDTPSPQTQELEQVIGILSKITSVPPQAIKPHLRLFIESLSKMKEDDFASASFYTTSTHEEWSAEFHDWVDSHKGKNIPVLSDEAMSRENMYPDRW